ncbi:MAG: Dabb family protein [Planctomycetota bacterium]
MLPFLLPVFGVLAALSLTACNALPRVDAPGRVAHTVFFWLRADAPSSLKHEMIDFYRTQVPKAPGIESINVGTPLPSDREVVDDSFDVGTTLVFTSAQDEKVWQDHPIHDDLRARFLPHVERVMVYDTLVADETR